MPSNMFGMAFDIDALRLQMEYSITRNFLILPGVDSKAKKDFLKILAVFEKHNVPVAEALDIMNELVNTLKEGTDASN